MKTLERPKFEGEKKPEKKETEAKYNFEAIAELEKPMEGLVEQLKKAIDKGEFDTLISDDAGGRIPTLVFREVMVARMRKAHPEFTPEQEREALKIYFVAGGRDKIDVKALEEFFRTIKPRVKKALLVTEYIHSGESLMRLGGLLESAQIDFGIAAAESWHKKINYLNESKIYQNHNFFIGKDNVDLQPRIYDWREDVGGVEKVRGVDEAHPRIYQPEPYGARETKEELLKKQREKVIKARQDVDLMASRILEKVWPK